MPKTCDQATVGILITDDRDRLLMITRGTAPAGIAPVAGHHDLHEAADHGALATPEDVARAEVAEEVGLEVTALHPTSVRDEWVATWCRRTLPVGAHTSGHRWTVYTAAAAGELAPDERETRGAAWYTRENLIALAERTAAYAAGHVPEEEWQASPGLEPVWCLLLTRLGWLDIDDGDLALIAAVATAGTVTHHDGATTEITVAPGRTSTVHRDPDGRQAWSRQEIDRVGPGETVVGMRL